MPYENTGKKIVAINYRKNDVSIKLSDGDKLEIPLDIYTSYYLYKNKILKDKEIADIKAKIENYKLLKYARKLLTTHLYTEKQIRDKLYLKEANKDQVDQIIKDLKKAGLIDDKNYVEEYVVHLKNQGYGKNKIIAKLKEKGIFKEYLAGLEFDDEDELERAISWINKIDKRYDKYPYNAKRNKVIAYLVNQGFDLDIATSISNKLSVKKDKDEYTLIKKDYQKIYQKYKDKYDDYELRNKIYVALKNKGYKSKDISKIMEENDI